MKEITLVTGNPGKLHELQAIAPTNMHFSVKDVDLDEIQVAPADHQRLVEDKVKKAFELVKGPVIVEDVSVGFDGYDDLPGPSYKFFRGARGDATLLDFAKIGGDKVTIRCIAGYYAGKQIVYGEGEIHGTVVEARGQNGFGFDPYIVPEGETRTMAEMTMEEKNSFSHRGQAFRSLLEQIQ